MPAACRFPLELTATLRQTLHRMADDPQQPRSLKLIYFDFGGRAEAVRLALHVGGVAFEDVRITEAEFKQQKDGAFEECAVSGRCEAVYWSNMARTTAHAPQQRGSTHLGLCPCWRWTA